MSKKSDDLSLEQIRQMAQSPAGKQLLAMLQDRNSGELNAAMAHAASGDYAQAKNALSALLSSPQVMEMLRKMKEDPHG